MVPPSVVHVWSGHRMVPLSMVHMWSCRGMAPPSAVHVWSGHRMVPLAMVHMWSCRGMVPPAVVHVWSTALDGPLLSGTGQVDGTGQKVRPGRREGPVRQGARPSVKLVRWSAGTDRDKRETLNRCDDGMSLKGSSRNRKTGDRVATRKVKR